MPVKKGAHELLTYLKDNGYTLVLTSSTFEPDVLFSLKSAGLDKYFDKFVCGDHVTRAKPNPEIFNKAIEIGVPDLVDISDMTQSHLLCTKENLLKVLDLIK